MAYTPTTLNLIHGKAHSGQRVFSYVTSDAMTAVRAAGYFSDAKFRYMAVGDIVYVTVVNGSGVPTDGYIAFVMAVTAGAADVSDGTQITVTNS